MDIIDVLEEMHIYPKKKSAKEYCSACPYCKEGNDRFTIWVNEGKGGRFWCRMCNKNGDAINLLHDFHGLTFLQACERLKLKVDARVTHTREKKPLIAKPPPEKWTKKATAFVDWSHDLLLQNQHFLSTLTARGITLETIKAFKLGYNPQKLFRQHANWGLEQELKDNEKPRHIWLPAGFVIPTFEKNKLIKVKIRNSNYEKELKRYTAMKTNGNLPKYPPSKYVVVKGSKKCPSVYGKTTLNTLLILESELDAILMIQEAEDLCFCLALGGSNQPLDLHKEKVVREAEILLFCPDFDEAGKKSWDRWIKRFPYTKRILTPYGKDPTEALKSKVNLREWIEETIIKL